VPERLRLLLTLSLLDLFFRLFFDDTLSSLHSADEFIPLSGNGVQIAVGKFTPALLNVFLELLPVSGDLL